MNPLTALCYVRLKPFDVVTEQGRAAERYRLAALAIIANVASRATGLLVTLLSVNLTLPYLGVDRFGVWMTIASFTAMLTFLDLGVGNALTNRVAQRVVQGNPELVRQTVSGGLAFLALIGLAASALLGLIAACLPWDRVMSLSDPTLVHETHQAAVCFALLFGFNVFTSGTQRVFAGLQLSVLGHLASLLGSLLSCLGLWWASGAQPGITGLLVIMLGGQSCASVLLLGVLVARRQLGLTGMAHALAIESPHLLKTGGLFLLLQIGTMIGWGADNLIISTTLGVAQVAVFSVVQRLFQLISQPLGILNAPLWGAYADAHARNDRQFIRKTLTRSFFVTIVGAILGAGLLLTAHAWLIEKWTHAKIEAPWPFVALYAIWVVFDACGNAFAMFLNGTGIVKQQVGVIMSFVVLVLPLKLLLIQVMGLQALPIATLVAYLATHVCLYGLVHRKDIAKNVSTAPI